MIVINESRATLVKVNSWEEIKERLGFSSPVDPKEIKLKEIIGRYDLTPMDRCGLSSCRTKHNKGFLVVCDGGIETNIGQKCGQREFGVKFRELAATFRRETNAQRHRLTIGEHKNRADDYERRVAFLWNGEQQGSWLYDQMHARMGRLFDEVTSKKLYERAKRKETEISRQVALDKKERQAAEQTGQKGMTHRTQRVALIAGLSAAKDYKKLKKLVEVQLGNELQAFKELDEEMLSNEELKYWDNWCSLVEKRIQHAQNILEDCQRFLLPSNIDLIIRNKHLL